MSKKQRLEEGTLEDEEADYPNSWKCPTCNRHYPNSQKVCSQCDPWFRKGLVVPNTGKVEKDDKAI